MRVIAMTPEQINQLPPQDRAITVQLVSSELRVSESWLCLHIMHYWVFLDGYMVFAGNMNVCAM